MRRWLTRLVVLFTLLPLALSAVACDVEALQEASTCTMSFDEGVESAYGDPALDTLFEATGHLADASKALEAETLAACNDLATALGAETSEDAAVACHNANEVVEAILDANQGAALTVAYIPSVCSVEAQAVVDCAASCDVNFDVEATPPVCEGGQLSGSCTGTCTGSCTIDADVACEGSCTGTCSGACSAHIEGSCEGTCTGSCSGECSVVNDDGSCAGTCTGVCQGSCEGSIEATCAGTCEGSCSGSCKADIDATCEGTCAGSCDVEFEAPHCEGGTLTVDASAECEAACEAEASFELTCTEPQIVPTYSGDPEDLAALEGLIVALGDNLGAVFKVLDKARLVLEASADVSAALGDATVAAVGIGLNAAACLVAAIDAQVEAVSRIEASVTVTIEVQASVSATAY